MNLEEKVKNMLTLSHDNFSVIQLWPILEYIIVTHLMHGLSLQKINKYDGCLINNKVYVDSLSLEERKSRVNKAKIRELTPYVKKMVNNFDENLLKDMYRNLSNVRFKKRRLLLIAGIGGMFDAKNNSITYSLNSSVGHELLHLSSSCYYPKTKERHVGFKQQRGMASIGRGLNEGYTELLASRIFNKNGNVESYYKEVRIAKLFEFFFDDPRDMQKYYFRHNLPGFILYMQKYIPRKELINILLNLDYVNALSLASPVITAYKNVKISMELYKYFLKTNPSREKRLAFEKVLRENKLVELTLENQKYKLQRNVTPFDNRRVRLALDEGRMMRAA